ncbi:MAG: aliphatic sulfonate ABC transporter substrate-binding protein [Lachnospiraceae bacterium]|nr:aliphatic sulfonate ABC transporter substrate-binding protein [Lachnospiraceae bacterium]
MKKNLWKKLISAAAVFTLATGVLAGCGSSSSATSGTTGTPAGSQSSQQTESVSEAAKPAEKKFLRVGAQSYPLYSSINVAQNLGYIEEELANVGAEEQWTLFASGPLVNEAVAAGEADIGFMADLPAIIAKSSGQDIQVVSNVATGEKSLAVLVRADSDITDISQLAGKKIAYATGSYAQHLLALVLDQAGLTFDDIESINLGAADSPTALANGDVDAIVIWEQFITKLSEAGTARVLIDGTGIKKSNMVVYAVKDYAEQNPEVIEAFIKAVNRGAQYISENPKDAAKILAVEYNVTEDEMVKILANFTFSVSLSQSDVDEITKVADYAYEAGIITNKIDASEFINVSYLKEAGF